MEIKQMVVGEMEVFCYIVICDRSRECVVIDPAGDEEKIFSEIRNAGLSLKYIVNTHGHADHTCGNAKMKALTGAQIVMHTLDDEFFRRPENVEWAKQMGFSPSPPADLTVEDGDVLKFGDLEMEIIHTPGHTPGSCCLKVGNKLFTGDTLFVGAVGRTDLPGASFEQLLKSLETKIITLPPETLILPGHDYGDQPTSTIKREMETNPYITDFILDED